MNVLEITAGQPWRRRVVFRDAKNVWATLPEVEVIAQLRTNKETDSRFIANLHTYMTLSFDGNDIVVLWSMTGAETAALYTLRWGNNKTGYFNIILSDVGSVDSRALPMPTVGLKCIDITTNVTGDL